MITVNHEQSPYIYKLPVELLADTFDYLPLKDLCAIRQTSKWFKQIAGHCYRKNYSALVRSINMQKNIELNIFHGLINAIEIYGKEHLKMHKYYPNGRSEFQQLKKLRFACVKLAEVKLEEMKEIGGEIECLEISDCKIVMSFEEKISIIFPNLKHLRMVFMGLPEPGSKWIACKYPSLERFELVSGFEDVTIGPFLEMIPTIQRLGIDSRNLLNNKESMKSAKLEDLAIKIQSWRNRHFSSESFCQILNELHELRSYKKLKVYTTCYYHDDEDEFIDLRSLHALT